MVLRLALLAAFWILSSGRECGACVALLVQASSLPENSPLHLTDASLEKLMQVRPRLELPDALGPRQDSEAFLELWNSLQSYDAGYLYEKALVRWAHQLNNHFGSNVGSLFLASVAWRTSGRFDASTRHFSHLPSAADFRLVLGTFFGPEGYENRTIFRVQQAMASLLLAGLEGLRGDFLKGLTLAERLQDETLTPTTDWDDSSAVYILRDGAASRYRGHFLRMNVESLPFETFIKNPPLARMHSEERGTLGILLEIPPELADSFASDVAAMRKWLKAYCKREQPKT